LNPTLGSKIEAVLQKGLSKQPEARYPTCAALVAALEEACASSPGWKSLARGASLNLPTMAEQQPPPNTTPEPAPIPPPPIRTLPAPRLRQEPESKSRVLSIFLTLLVGGALAVGVYFGRQIFLEGSSPPVIPAPEPAKVEPREPAPAKIETKKTEPKKEEETPPKPVETPVEPVPAEIPPVTRQKTEPLRREPARPRSTAIQEIPVRTQPSGASVILDGLSGTECFTPCVLRAGVGEHTLSFQHAGYKSLNRVIKVEDPPVELPPFTLAQAQGVLMVQSQPGGAEIMVNDKRWPGVTPAQVSLSPGKYTITVQKGDMKGVQTIEVRDGDLRVLRLVLTQQ
jgi:hypothetical protein